MRINDDEFFNWRQINFSLTELFTKLTFQYLILEVREKGGRRGLD